MASLASIFGNKGFDASAVEPADDFETIPAGQYKAIIIESELADNKSLTGKNLRFKFQIVDGKFKKRTIQTWMAVNNPNETAVRIAKQSLAQLSMAVNVQNWVDTAKLHGKPFLLVIKHEPDNRNGGMREAVAGYKPLENAASDYDGQTADDEADDDVPF